MEDYTKAITLDPKYTFAYNSRGNAYNKLGEHQKAIADFNKAIELDPKYIFAYNNRGNSYDALGNYQQAINDYTKAMELDPKYADAYYNRGNTHNHILAVRKSYHFIWGIERKCYIAFGSSVHERRGFITLF